MDFVSTHTQAMLNIAPRTEPLETPIDVVVETREDWSGNPYKTKIIKEVVDNAWLIPYDPGYDRKNRRKKKQIHRSTWISNKGRGRSARPGILSRGIRAMG
jgi:hypothetical protein